MLRFIAVDVGWGGIWKEVSFTNRGTFAFSRRERPHLIWKEGGSAAGGVKPIALSYGVEYGRLANTAGDDTIFTLDQQLQQ